MDSISSNIIDRVLVVWLDASLIFSNLTAEHISHLRKVLSRLRDVKLYVGEDKGDAF